MLKIFIITPPNEYLKPYDGAVYPQHNSLNYGVEQDFYKFINKNQNLLTHNHTEADWHYLPIFWTSWYLKNNYGQSGNFKLAHDSQRVIIDDRKTFTICQYSDGPGVYLGETIIFQSSRRTNTGVDIPTLCDPHKKPRILPPKKYLASFIGRFGTHRVRSEMSNILKNRDDVYIHDGILKNQYKLSILKKLEYYRIIPKKRREKYFVNTILKSYISLAPRGYGGGSFRFYESMSLGVVPVLIGDIDVRPFKKFIDWDINSFYCNDVNEIYNIDKYATKKELLTLGKNAEKTFKEKLHYQLWCKYVINELEDMN